MWQSQTPILGSFAKEIRHEVAPSSVSSGSRQDTWKWRWRSAARPGIFTITFGGLGGGRCWGQGHECSDSSGAPEGAVRIACFGLELVTGGDLGASERVETGASLN